MLLFNNNRSIVCQLKSGPGDFYKKILIKRKESSVALSLILKTDATNIRLKVSSKGKMKISIT